MNAEQKRAWLGVATMSACLVGYSLLLGLVGPGRAVAAFALFGLNGFAPIVGRKEKADERDRSIERRATLIGAMFSYLAFVLGCMGTWGVVYALGRQSVVSVHAFVMITILGGVIFYFVRSVAVLVLYGRHVEAGDA